jgi:ribosome biogenesis GTPase
VPDRELAGWLGQGQALAALGFDEAWNDLFARFERRGLQAGRIAGVDRAALDVLCAGGPVRATVGGPVLQAIATDPTAGPCSGDWAALRSWPDGRTTVEALLPRRTAVTRAVASGVSRGQVLAANVEVVLVAVSLQVDPSLPRIERMLTLAWDSGATPVLVLTKADLAPDADFVAQDLRALAPGVDVVVVSAVTGDGLELLSGLASPRRTLALIGQSGVGKSTLVNSLAGSSVATVAAIGAGGRGRHTTVRRDLVQLPTGALLIDTPGLRGVGLIDAGQGAQGLARAFPDIEELSLACRFADCAHSSEPDCAVMAAVATRLCPNDVCIPGGRWLRRAGGWPSAATPGPAPSSGGSGRRSPGRFDGTD